MCEILAAFACWISDLVYVLPMKLTHIRNLDVTDPLASGHPFLSAASGLVHIGETLYVVGDDEQHLAVFNQNDNGPGHLLRLLTGDLPRKAKKRKKVKPDFEILLRLPSPDEGASGLICAMGSGSTPERMRGAIIDLDTSSVTVLDLQPLFAALAPLVAEINLEGAVLRGDRLLLFNRGNMSNPETCIFETALAAVTGNEPAQARLVKTLALPLIDDVPLTVTDACSMGDGQYLLSAVAEVTDDSYADGDILGAAIILLNADLDVIAIEPLEPTLKIEGISAVRTTTGAELLCVSDADDPDTPSSLYSASLRI
jgi:hypothetical protein